jgi:hypothetical protein
MARDAARSHQHRAEAVHFLTSSDEEPAPKIWQTNDELRADVLRVRRIKAGIVRSARLFDGEVHGFLTTSGEEGASSTAVDGEEEEVRDEIESAGLVPDPFAAREDTAALKRERAAVLVANLTRGQVAPTSEVQYGKHVRAVNDLRDEMCQEAGPLTENRMLEVLSYGVEEHDWGWSQCSGAVAAIKWQMTQPGMKRHYKPLGERTSLFLKNLKRKVGGKKRPTLRGLTAEDMTDMAQRHQDAMGDLRKGKGWTTAMVQYSMMNRAGSMHLILRKHIWELDETRYLLRVPKDKGDQDGNGHEVQLVDGVQPYNGFRWLRAWLQAKNFAPEEKVFGGRSCILSAIKTWAKEAGCDPRQYSTHSLRRGSAHNAALTGVSAAAIKEQGGWRSEQWHGYVNLAPDEAGTMTGVF